MLFHDIGSQLFFEPRLGGIFSRETEAWRDSKC